jgi:integrase
VPRPSTGQVIAKHGVRGTTFALRFRAYGARRYVTLGTEAAGWSQQRAERELAYVLQQVERGVWQPPASEPADLPLADPTFHVFASEWWAAKRLTVRPNTIAAYENELTVHLLPFFARHRLSQITVAEVDRYREHKVREGRLGAETINKTLTRLGQILDVAEERGLIARNPLRVNPRNRKLKVNRKRPVYLDTAEQITALLHAASDLDAGKQARTSGRRALLATLVFGGLRVSEACALRWRDVDLAGGRLTVGSAKTDAGVREVDIRPVLRDELLAYKAGRRRTDHDDLVFTTAARTPRDKDNVRSKVLEPVVARADELLAAAEAMPLPQGVTAHKLRHTFASILAALGVPMPNVMSELGHTDPAFTLRVYAHMMRRSDEEHERLRALVEGRQLSLEEDGRVLGQEEQRWISEGSADLGAGFFSRRGTDGERVTRDPGELTAGCDGPDSVPADLVEPGLLESRGAFVIEGSTGDDTPDRLEAHGVETTPGTGHDWAPLGTRDGNGLPEEAESSARPAGFEPATSRSGGERSIH